MPNHWVTSASALRGFSLMYEQPLLLLQQLRRRIEGSIDIGSLETRCWVIQACNLLPASVTDRDAIQHRLRMTIDLLLVAGSISAPCDLERRNALAALDEIADYVR